MRLLLRQGPPGCTRRVQCVSKPPCVAPALPRQVSCSGGGAGRRSSSSDRGSSSSFIFRHRVAAAAAAGGGSAAGDDDLDEADDYDEFAEAPLDDESVRERQLMAAQAGPSNAGGFEADEGEYEELEEDDSPFPEPEPRCIPLCDLLGLAAEVDAAALMEEAFGDVLVAGVSDDPSAVMPGDLFCCVERTSHNGQFSGHAPDAVGAALEGGATAILAEMGRRFPEGLIPDSVPVLYAEDVDELAARLAAVLLGGPGRGMTLVTVSGSSGKTTVAWLVRGVLEQAGQLTGMVGSIEHALAEHLMAPDGSLWEPGEPDPAEGRECASPFHLVPYQGRYCLEETTPSGLRVQKLLAGMRDRGATAAVVEVDAEAFATGSLEWVQPSIAVFTNSTETPDGIFDSREEYLDTLLQLFRGLQDADSQCAVINLDDEAGPAVRQAAAAVPCITYSISNTAADVHVVDLQLSLWRTTMIVATPVGRLEIITNLIGRHNVSNVLATVAVGVQLELPLSDIGAGVESVQFVPGRCEVVNSNDLDLLDPEAPDAEQQQQQQRGAQLPQDFAVVVDLADTPQRMAGVLTALREAGAARVFTVFGCDGQVTSGEMRARMGEVAHQRSEFVILTNTSPGMEEPPEIIQDIVSGWPNDLFERYAAYVYNVFQDQTHAPLWFEPFLHSAQRRWKRHIIEDRFQAIRAAIGTAQPGDVVVLAGRGHKDWVDYADGEGGVVRGWFDDRVEARNALAKLEYLYALVDLDRSQLPWRRPGDESKSVVEID